MATQVEHTSRKNTVDGGSIHKAAYRGNLPRLQFLVSVEKSAVNSKDANGATALHHAAFKGNLDCLRFLVEKGALLDSLDRDHCTPLHNAAFTDKSECVLFLIAHGATVDYRDIDNATPLHKACFNGNYETSKLLIESGADINAVDNDGISALQKATYNDHVRCIELLLNHGADINSADNKGSSALHKAAFNGFLKSCETLIDRGIDVNMKDNEDTTSLHNAVYNGHTELVTLLLNNGAAVNCSTAKYKSTPLHFAAFNGYLDCIKLLLDKGASIDSTDAKGMTPLHYAVKRNHEDCIEFLITRGADVNAKDQKRRTWRELTESKTIIKLFGEKTPLPQSPKQTNKQKRIPSKEKTSEGEEVKSVSSDKSDKSDKSETKTNNRAKREDSLNSNGSLSDEEIYRKLDRNGFVISDENQEDDDPKDKKKEMDRAVKWIKMMHKWDLFLKKDAKKIKTRCEKGIPARVRGQAWKLLTRSSPEQFALRKQVEYKKLILQESEMEGQIVKDLARTFPKHIYLMQKTGQEVLLNVLKGYSIFNKDVGYCQGMGFVTALLLMYMEEEDAFWALARICTAYECGDLWNPKLSGLKECHFVLGELMKLYVPKVQQHLAKQEVFMEIYATQWFLTLFLYNMPFTLVLRIWDIFLFEGFHFIYATALALLKYYEETITTLGFEDCCSFLQFQHNKKAPVMNSSDIEQIIKVANGYKEKVKRSLKQILDKSKERTKVSSQNES